MQAATIIKLRFNTSDGDIDIEISEEEARDLHSFLDKLFGEKKSTITWPTYPIYRDIIRHDPVWTGDVIGDNPSAQPMITWCQSNVGANTI